MPLESTHCSFNVGVARMKVEGPMCLRGHLEWKEMFSDSVAQCRLYERPSSVTQPQRRRDLGAGGAYKIPFFFILFFFFFYFWILSYLLGVQIYKSQYNFDVDCKKCG